MRSNLDPERIKRPWEEQYRDDDVETMPWFCAAMDKDVAATIARLSIAAGSALDIGSGPGTQTIALAKLGFDATGTDISPSAVKKAMARAAQENVDVRFVCDDVLHSQLQGTFTLIIDRGCFHVIDAPQRQGYLDSVIRLLDREGYLLLKTFHNQETREQGPPNRFETADIAALFAPHFDVIESYDSVFESTMDSDPKALFCVLRKSGGNQ